MRLSGYIKIVFFMLISMSFILPSKALALDNSNVISDASMRYSTSMSATEINNFFRANGSWMTDYVIPEYVSVPYPTTSGLQYVNARQVNDLTGEVLYGKTVAQLIADESIAHGINPQVILATLQKESSAITRSTPSSNTTRAWPLFYMYNESMGDCLNYGTSCNDSLFRQNAIDYGGIGLQFAYATNWFDKRMGTYASTYMNPITIDGQTIVCANVATRVLYLYTPHIQTSFYNLYHGWFVASASLSVSRGGSIKATTNSQSKICNEGTCKLQFPEGANITLTVNGDPTIPAEFVGWSGGGCSGTYPTCTTQMMDGLTIAAYFSHSLINESKYESGYNSWWFDPIAKPTSFKYGGKDSIVSPYNYGNDQIGLWVFVNSNGELNLKKVFDSGPDGWDLKRTSNFISGDFDGDGIDEIAAMYDYGNSHVKIWIFKQENGNLIPQIKWDSGVNNWYLAGTSNLVSGDFDGDGIDEIAAMYNYGNAQTKLWIFKHNNGYFTPSIAFDSGPNGWDFYSQGDVIAGNFNGGDKDEIAVMYNYWNARTKIWIFNDYIPSVKYDSGYNSWDFNSTGSILGVDLNGDLVDEIAATYNYNNSHMKLWVFNYEGTHPQMWFDSGSYGWDLGKYSSSDLIGGVDYNGDGKQEISALYNYGNAKIKVWGFSKSGYAYTNGF